jgi:type I restriction enzyme M protein
MAGFVLANGSMSSNQSGDCNARSARREWATISQGLGSQRDIRKALIEADREMSNDELRVPNRAFPASTFELHPANFPTALPGQLFYSRQIPVCLWFCGENNTLDSANDARLFDGETELSLVA